MLDGRLPQKMLDSFSCRQVMTPAEVRDGCRNGGVFATGAPHSHAVALAAGRMRYSIGWGRTLDCASGQRADQGTYQVVVRQYADGWAVTSYKVLTGPGAGASG